MDEKNTPQQFQFFNEIGIIGQLSRATMDARLPDGLITPHFAVLNHLVRVGDGPTPVELARAFQVAKTTMTHTLSGLVKNGLVQERPNPDDKRSKRIWLTDHGRDFRLDAMKHTVQSLQPLQDILTQERLAEVLPLLVQVRKAMDKNRP